ncbi:MAG: putative PEP-binding protein, partial [bacterium]
GVGALMRQAITGGRKTRPGIKLGICGEHGGDPSSVEFCHELGLDYVSCSPYRIPIARLAAAHDALAEAGSSGSLSARTVSAARVKGRKTTKTKSAQRPRSRSRVTRKRR